MKCLNTFIDVNKLAEFNSLRKLFNAVLIFFFSIDVVLSWQAAKHHIDALILIVKGMRERIRKANVRELMCWDKDNLIARAKAAHTSKAKQRIHSLLPIRGIFLGKQSSSCMMISWEDKCHH